MYFDVMDNVVIEVPFGKIEIINQCVIHTANEGVDIGRDEILVIEEVIKQHTDGEVGYISNQVNDYSMSAVHLANTLKNTPVIINHLAFVYYSDSRHTALQSVLRLLPDNMLINMFDDLGDAKQWIEQCIADPGDARDLLTDNSL